MNFSPSDMLGEIEGSFSATFTGTREEGGTKVAVITLKIEGNSSNDMTEKMQSMTEKMSEQTGATMKIDSFDGEWEYEAEGELLWNLEAGVVHSLNLSGELQMTVDVQMSVDAGGRSAEMQITQSYGGNQTVILTAGS